MALTPTLQASQATTEALLGQQASEVLSPQFSAQVAISFPSPALRVSQTVAQVIPVQLTTVQASGLVVQAAVIGRPEIRKARNWTFSLDGHDFYALRLGDSETLVLDLTTGSWSTWSSANRPNWRAHLGTNWIAMGRSNYEGGARTNVVAGDDAYGLLWTLDPDSGLDESPRADLEAEPFKRIVSGGVPARMRESARNNAVFLTVDVGGPAFSPASIELRTSDDNGKTFQSQGEVTIPAAEYNTEIMWRSLGLIRAPGRIFEFHDTGATVRIDGADVRLTSDRTDG